MDELLEKKSDALRGIQDPVSQQDLQVYERLSTLLRKVIAEKYRDKMGAETVEKNVQDLARRVTAHIANLGKDQYRRVRPSVQDLTKVKIQN